MTTTNGYHAVIADMENNAEVFWDAVHEKYPVFARSLGRNGGAVIGAGVWEVLAALPGFADGPDYATAALIDCGSEGDQWDAAVDKGHEVFDALS